MFIFRFFKMIIISILAFVVILCTLVAKDWQFPKDDIINAYDTFIQSFDFAGLSKDRELKGNRTIGIDKYVGTYNAKYSNYTGNETIFGGTALHRKNGDHLKLTIKVQKQNGNIKVISKLGDNEMTLIEDTGEYEDTIYIDGMSYYLIVKLDNFTGSIDVVSE